MVLTKYTGSFSLLSVKKFVELLEVGSPEWGGKESLEKSFPGFLFSSCL